jgi:alkylation response protein AidB-like acyl-CoA dehydrogenase
LDLTFSPEDRLFREQVRDWLDDNVPREPRPRDGAAMRAFDTAWQRRQHDAGWAGIAWPREYGGRGLSLVQQMIWQEEYARAGAPLPGSMFVALNHGGPTLIVRGSEHQKREHLPRILRGESVWCQGFSEPGAGSDLASLRARAVIDGDHLVVNGQKIWTSYADQADFQELLVRTDPAMPRHKGITWVICDMKLPGITVRRIPSMAGYTPFCEVFYDNVRIPLANVVGAIDDGWNVAMSTLSFERGTALICYQVELEQTVEKLVHLARETTGPDGVRKAFAHDDIACRLGQLRAEVAALRSMTYVTISRAQRQDVPGPESTMPAVYFGELLNRAHRLALDILGPVGLARGGVAGSWPFYYLDVFKQVIAGGTSEIRRNIIGERVLGLPR